MRERCIKSKVLCKKVDGVHYPSCCDLLHIFPYKHDFIFKKKTSKLALINQVSFIFQMFNFLRPS